MKQYLIELYNGTEFSRSDAKEIMLSITNGQVTNEQIAAFLMAINMRKLVVNELLGFRDALLEQALEIPLQEYDTIDIVGTGGDGKNTFNISTCTALVVAGAGYKVAKHGSNGVSSISGSSNVLQELGVSFHTNIDRLKQSLEQANICFIHAPFFHPTMKLVGPVRKALRIKTIFNCLGPLINPAGSSYGLYGVYNQKLLTIYADVFRQTNIKNFTIVHASDGYDEVSLTSDAFIANADKQYSLSPSAFNTIAVQPTSILGGNSVKDAANIFLSILENSSESAQREVVLANAALAIQTIRPSLTLQEAKEQAKQSIDSGAAKTALFKLIEISNH